MNKLKLNKLVAVLFPVVLVLLVIWAIPHTSTLKADGGLSAMVGRDRLGPTAVLKTVSKLDNMLMVNGSLLNLKFQPNILKGKEGIEKFANFLRAYTKLKIQHIQFNVQTRETLLEAQKNPENYRGLVVRVAGYSAFFVDLNEKIQNDIIARAEHVL